MGRQAALLRCLGCLEAVLDVLWGGLLELCLGALLGSGGRLGRLLGLYWGVS